ncbi:MAG: Hsp70 family protein [Pseudomonadota bacterium]
MASHCHRLAVDFGTSNSAAGYLRSGTPHLIPLAPGQKTLPTALFFDFETRETLIGEPAIEALLKGSTGRFMRALKRVLGTTLMHEPRQILNERVTFVEIIARFLAKIKEDAEAEAGQRFETVLSGRPVYFHGDGDPREAQAEADLRDCYLKAGFREVSFLFEPVAGAIASGALDHPGECGLVVDIGGGTSDFSIFRSVGQDISSLANHGIRLGGTDFDRSLSLTQVMPWLGKGGQLQKGLGAGTTPVSNAIFHELATWETIPFVYTGRNRRMASEMARLAVDPEKLGRLLTVLENELGHDLAFAVERSKIAANCGALDPSVDLEVVETGFAVPLDTDALNSILESVAATLLKGAEETLRQAGLGTKDVTRVVYVGGSSLMSVILSAFRRAYPNANHDVGEVFTAVADGLAIAAARLPSAGFKDQ